MAAYNYAACLAVTLVEEGGKVDDPRDPGGRTNEGVTQVTYDAYRRRKGLAPRDVYLMTPAERDEIYQTGFWVPAGCDALPAGLDLMQFDGSVNSGVGRAKTWLAKVKTAGPPTYQVRAYATARLSFLEALANWRTFGRGWGRRVATVEAKALAMAAIAVPGGSATVVAVHAASHVKRAAIAGATAHAAVVATAGAVLAPALVTVAHPAVAAAVGAGGLVATLAALFERWRSGLRAEAHQDALKAA